MHISSFTGFIPGFRHFRLDNGPLLIGIAVVAAVIEAAFLFSLFLPTSATTTSAAAADTNPMRVIGAAPRSETSCGDQTWPYIDRKCLTQAAEKRPSHGARPTDLNAPPEEVGAILRAAAPATPDSFNSRFWPMAITAAAVTTPPSTDGVAPKVKEAAPPQETRSVRVARPVREAARQPAGETRTAREVRSDIERSPDGRQWKRTTYTAPLASGGTKTFQVTRQLQQHHATWGVFGRGF
jgi:hypothetical protein